MRILLDVDGVLADFVGGVLPIVSRMLGREVSRHEITGFSLERSLHLTPTQCLDLFHEIDTTPSWCWNLAPLSGAVDGVRALAKLGTIFVVTSPWNSRPTWTHEREQWLGHFFAIDSHHVIHTSAKHLVRGDVLIDDKTSTLHAWAAEHSGLPIQWATPHNRRDGWTGVSTCSWPDLVATIEDYKAARLAA